METRAFMEVEGLIKESRSIKTEQQMTDRPLPDLSYQVQYCARQWTFAL